LCWAVTPLKLWLHERLTAIGLQWVVGYAEASAACTSSCVQVGR
jgi:hypothetical protein